MAADARDDQLEGSWRLFKGRVKEAWGDLRGDGRKQAEGRRDQLVGHLQAEAARERAEVERDIHASRERTLDRW